MFVALAVDPAAAQQAGDQADRGRRGVRAAERAKLGPLSRAERNTLIAFVVTVALWILPGIVALVAGTDSAAYDDGLRPARRGHRRRPRRLAAVPAADRLGEARVHPHLERRGPDRLGHDPALRHRHHLRLAAGRHRPGRDDRHRQRRRARPGQRRRDHDLRGACWRSSSPRRRPTPPPPRWWCRSSSRSPWPPASTRSCPRWRRRSRRRSASCCRCRPRRTRSSTAPAWCRSPR